MFLFLRISLFCALFISIGSAQDCSTIFENNTKDSNYWYGFSIKDINRKSQIKKISEQVVISSVKNLSFSIYSNVIANDSQNIIDEFDGKKGRFSDKFVSNVSVSTKVSGIEYEIVSQGKCDKQYYSLVRLEKSSFKSRENVKFNSLINKSNELSIDAFSNLFDYLTYINQLYVDFDNLLIGIFESSYQSRIDARKNYLQNNYFSVISSIKPSFNYSIPYNKYDKRSNYLEITFASNTVNIPLTSGEVSIKFLSKAKKYDFNSSGKILFALNNNVRNQKSPNIEIELNLNKLLSDHFLYKNKKSKNTKFDFVISEQPLVFHFSNNFDDDQLSSYFFKHFKANIFSKINFNLANNLDAPFELKIEALDVVKDFNEVTNQYIYIVRGVNFKIINKITNQVIFTVEKDSLKGISFQSFDKAAKRIERDLKTINQEMKNELYNKIILS